jgi:hypothetical protein
MRSRHVKKFESRVWLGTPKVLELSSCLELNYWWSARVAFNNNFWRDQNRLERDFFEHENLTWCWCQCRNCCQSEQQWCGQVLPCDLECGGDAFRLVLIAGARAVQNFGWFEVLRECTAGNGQDQHRHKPEHGSCQVRVRVCPVRHRRKYTRESHENQAEMGSRQSLQSKLGNQDFDI